MSAAAFTRGVTARAAVSPNRIMWGHAHDYLLPRLPHFGDKMILVRTPPPANWRETRVLACLRAAAKAGARCPTNEDIQSAIRCDFPKPERPAQLALRGLGRVEIYGRNYRVFEFPDGMRTAECPHGGKPYRVLDKDGDQWL